MRKIIVSTEEYDCGVQPVALAYFDIGNDKHDRTDERLINLVENPDKASSDMERCYIQDLAVVTIPDEATDWDVLPWNNFEAIVYVVNGKLNYAFPED